MDEQIVELIRDGFEQVNRRLDEQRDLWAQHVEDDKKAWEKLDDVSTEVKVAKRVFYIIGGGVTAVLGWLGITK